MPMLPDEIKGQVKEAFAAITTPVKLVNFTQTLECAYCRETRELLEEIAALSDLVSLEVHNFVTDPEPVKAYGIDKIPATAIVGHLSFNTFDLWPVYWLILGAPWLPLVAVEGALAAVAGWALWRLQQGDG